MVVVKFAAVLPAAASKEDYSLVSVADIRNFNPKSNDDFDSKKLYRYKPPSAEHATLVFILRLGKSIQELRKSCAVQRLQFPNRRLLSRDVQPLPSTDEECTQSQASTSAAVKEVGKQKSAAKILGEYRKRSKASSQLTPEGQKIQGEASAPDPHSNDHIIGDSQMSELSQKPSCPPKASEPLPSLSSSSETPASIPVQAAVSELKKLMAQVQSLQEQYTVAQQTWINQEKSIEEKFTSAQQKLQSIQNETEAMLEEGRRKNEAIEKKLNADKEELLKLRREIEQERRDLLQERKRTAEEALTRAGTSTCSHPHSSSGSISSKASGSVESSSSSTQLDIEKVPIGKGVVVDADVWALAMEASNKDDWAYYALVACFGDDAMFYRFRTPRSDRHILKLVPKHPPYLSVLQHYFKKWLRTHPEILNARPKEPKRPIDSKKQPVGKDRNNHDTQSSDEDILSDDAETQKDLEWSEKLQAESDMERAARHRSIIEKMCKLLPGTLGDKAINMFRQGKRPAKGASGHGSKKTKNMKVIEALRPDTRAGVLEGRPGSRAQEDTVTPDNDRETDEAESDIELTDLTPRSSQLIRQQRRYRQCANWQMSPRAISSQVDETFDPVYRSTERTGSDDDITDNERESDGSETEYNPASGEDDDMESEDIIPNSQL